MAILHGECTRRVGLWQVIREYQSTQTATLGASDSRIRQLVNILTLERFFVGRVNT
jgi:hypothetical protein